jgi:hypothetical protein
MSRDTTLDAERRAPPQGDLKTPSSASAVLRSGLAPPFKRRWRTTQPAKIIVAGPANLIVAVHRERQFASRMW